MRIVASSITGAFNTILEVLSNVHTDDKNDRDDDELVQALRRITKLPLEDGNGAGIKTISAIVILGDRAYDLEREAPLKEVLHEPQLGPCRAMLDGPGAPALIPYRMACILYCAKLHWRYLRVKTLEEAIDIWN